MTNNNITEIDQKQLSELIARVEQAIAHDLALSAEDLKLLLLAITTLSELQYHIEEDNITLYKLRKLLGMVKQSESRRNNFAATSQKKGKKKPNKRSFKKNQATKSPTVVHHAIVDYKKGDVCPCCNNGKLYKHAPCTLLRVTGHAPFEATQHVSEQYRCNACQQIFSAPLPAEVLKDGDPQQKYGFSARALMALSKFYSGLPYYHQSNLSSILGCSISASTCYDQCVLVSYALEPVYQALQQLAADAPFLDIDDTHNRILSQQPEMRSNRHGSGQRLRSGVYTSGLIATLADSNHEIILFETSLGHAGEHLDSILSQRDSNLPAPVVMSDALSSNTSSYPTIQTNCNAHSRRQFYDVATTRPEEVEWLLERYSLIWQHDSHSKNTNHTPAERLSYHKDHSLPVMQELHSWATKHATDADFEEHSGFGKAINYFLRHFDKLAKFCSIEGAKIDNNRMEERLKQTIRVRKTSHFFKTPEGARVANIITSVIATADVSGINIFDYLLELQRNRVAVADNPKAWLPWNYAQTMKTNNSKQGPPLAA